MSRLEPVHCDECSEQIGWTYYSGPRGMMFCDECGAAKDAEDEKENEEAS